MLKYGDIKPLIKKGDKNSTANDRTVPLFLTLFSKFIEIGHEFKIVSTYKY